MKMKSSSTRHVGEKRVLDFVADSVAKIAFFVSAAAALWLFGAYSATRDLVPYPQIKLALTHARQVVNELRGVSAPQETWFFYRPAPPSAQTARTYLPNDVSPGFTLTYGIGNDHKLDVRIVDSAGNDLHRWDMDIFALWPNFDHVPESRRPKSNPGGDINGLVFMPNGDIIFNFEPAGLMRLDYCGDVVWRLPYFTHHSAYLDENGNIFVSARKYHEESLPGWPNLVPEIFEEMVLEVSPDGEIVDEISVFDLLKRNNLEGLLYASSTALFGAEVKGDLLHLNDVETFPSNLPSGVFERGDIMISLRNKNTIIVFNQASRKIKYVYTGSVVWQHDPDFVSGDEISIFDNHSIARSLMNRKRRPENISSRIVTINARDNSMKVVFEGSKDIPFYTDIIGKQQRLPNGNLLLTESRWGRMIELTPDGRLAWEYNNILKSGVAKGSLGLLMDGQRLAPEIDRAALDRFQSTCAR